MMMIRKMTTILRKMAKRKEKKKIERELKKKMK